MAATAAIVFTVLIGALCLFQLALALGAPWGRVAWGGQHSGRLPAGYRVGSALGILVYAAFAMLALNRAQMIEVLPDAISRVGMWVVFGVLALGTCMNLISRSKPERYAMTPVALVLTVLALLIALFGPGQQPIANEVGSFTVIDDGNGAVLCDGAVMESHPPQCAGRQIIAWQWDAVDHFEEVGEVRWGEFDLAVVAEGEQVRVVVAEPGEESADDGGALGDFGRPSATWLEPGSVFELVTYGSSSCPSVVAGIEATRVDQVVLHLEQSGGEVCTADLAPTEHRVTLPDAVVERPVTVLLDFTEHDTLLKLTLG